MIYIFEVRDDEMCSLPCKEFSKFADAFDYAQDGLTTRIFQVPVEDGCEPCYDDCKCVWDWSTPEDRDTLVRLFDGCSPSPVCEAMDVEDIRRLADNDHISEDDLAVQVESEFKDKTRKDSDEVLLEGLSPEEFNELNNISAKLGLNTFSEVQNFYAKNKIENEEILDTLKRCATSNNTTPTCTDVQTCKAQALVKVKEENKPVVYGYHNRKYPNKFFPLPLHVCANYEELDEYDSLIRKKYGANVLYVAYPDKPFAGELEEDISDEEFIEAFGKALYEKKNSNETNLVEDTKDFIKDKFTKYKDLRAEKKADAKTAGILGSNDQNKIKKVVYDYDAIEKTENGLFKPNSIKVTKGANDPNAVLVKSFVDAVTSAFAHMKQDPKSSIYIAAELKTGTAKPQIVQEYKDGKLVNDYYNALKGLNNTTTTSEEPKAEETPNVEEKPTEKVEEKPEVVATNVPSNKSKTIRNILTTAGLNAKTVGAAKLNSLVKTLSEL